MAKPIPGREGKLKAARDKHGNMRTRELRALALGPPLVKPPARFTAPPCSGGPVPFFADLASRGC